MSETTAKMLVHAVTGKLIPQSYDPALDAFVADKSTGGAKHVTTMPGGTEYILEQDALSTAVTFDWTSIAPNGIKAISFKLSMEAATTPDINSIAGIAAPNSDAFRDSALTAGTSLAAAVARITHRVKDGQLDLIFTSPIYKFGMKRDLGSDALRVTAIGIGA